MLPGLWVSVTFAQTEVYHVAHILFFIDTHEKIVGLHISMQKVVLMQELESRNHLVSQHADGLQRKPFTTVLKEIL
jgi:hypothetical protein